MEENESQDNLKEQANSKITGKQSSFGKALDKLFFTLGKFKVSSLPRSTRLVLGHLF